MRDEASVPPEQNVPVGEIANNTVQTVIKTAEDRLKIVLIEFERAWEAKSEGQ